VSDQVHLFERFFRATNVTNIQGTGLGLHIVGRYVEILKGTIKYHSEFEKGSCFEILLPTKIINDFE
jgi:signal transduction histidine kinase